MDNNINNNDFNNNEGFEQGEYHFTYADFNQPEPKKNKTPFWKKPAAIIAGVIVAGMLSGFAGSAIANSVTGGSTTIFEGDRPSSVINTASVDTGKQMTAAEVYAANVNSTVGITTQVTTNYWGYTTTAAAAG